jgi:hypothetical protein
LIVKINMKLKRKEMKPRGVHEHCCRRTVKVDLKIPRQVGGWKILHSRICALVSASDVESIIKQTSNPSAVPFSNKPRAPRGLPLTLAALPPPTHALQPGRDKSTSVLEKTASWASDIGTFRVTVRSTSYCSPKCFL